MPQVLKEEVRKKIVSSAIRTFKENDYNKASMNTIADEANISVGNIYRYFKNKEELFDMIVKDLAEKVVSIMDECKHGESIDEVFERLRNCIDKFVDIYEGNEDVFVILIKSSGKSKSKYNVERPLASYLAENLSIIAQNFNENMSLSDEERNSLCQTLAVAITKGVNQIILTGQEEIDMKKRLYNFLDFMRIGFVENLKRN